MDNECASIGEALERLAARQKWCDGVRSRYPRAPIYREQIDHEILTTMPRELVPSDSEMELLERFARECNRLADQAGVAVNLIESSRITATPKRRRGPKRIGKVLSPPKDDLAKWLVHWL